MDRLFKVIPDALWIEHRNRVLGERPRDRDDIYFLNAELAHTKRISVCVKHSIGTLHLSRNKQDRSGIEPCSSETRDGIRSAGTRGHQGNSQMVGSLRIVLCGDCARLLMGIADRL